MHPEVHHVGARKSAPRRPVGELSDWILDLAWLVLVLAIVAIVAAWVVVMFVA